MPFAPDTPFPKSLGDKIRSKDWNDAVNEILRLETAKVNRAGDAVTGPLTIQGNIGIGTTGPAAKLHVLSVEPHARIESSGDRALIQFAKAGAPQWDFGVGRGAGDNDFWFGDMSAYRMVLQKGTGNVGIGTTTPGAKLEVSASSVHFRLRREASETTGGKLLFLELVQDDSNPPKVPEVYPSIRFHHGFRFWNRIEGRSDGIHFKVGSLDVDSYIKIFAGDAAFSGNVGIGTTGPTHKFHVLAADAVGLFESTGTQAFLRLSTNEGIGNRVEITNRPGGRLSLWTAGGGDVFNILKDGIVGIGTISPQFGRVMIEDVSVPLSFRETGVAVDQGGLWRIPLDGGTLRFDINTGAPGSEFGNNYRTTLAMTKEGNVGIGTVAPTHKFHVLAADAVGLFESTGTQAFLRLSTSEGLNNRVELTNRPGGRLSLWTAGAGDVFNILKDGRIGIGTTSPNGSLDVANLVRFGFDEGGSGARVITFARNPADEVNAGKIAYRPPGWDAGVLAIVGAGVVPNRRIRMWDDLIVNNNAFKPGGGAWGVFSDMRLKKNVESLKGALEKLLQLRGVSFEWKEPEKQGNLTGKQMGLVAQEAEEIFPEWVGTDPEGMKYLTVRGFEALTIEALRELHEENESLKTKIKELETKLKAVEKKRKTGD